MSARRRGRERGQVTVFVVGLAVALMLVIGLTIDGGRALASRQRAVDEAQEAARTGAQALSGAALYGSAGTALDPQQAYTAAQRYIAATGDSARRDRRRRPGARARAHHRDPSDPQPRRGQHPVDDGDGNGHR